MMQNVRISDLLDGMEAPNYGLKESAAVSPERIKEIAMKKIHTEPKHHTAKRKRSAVLIFAAALALALSVTALAAYHSGFFNNAFGSGVAGQEAYDNPLTDKDGNVVKTEHYPAMERVETDEEKAEALVGAYVAEIGQSVKLENYTFTVENALLDENGVGVLTLHIENPDGHGIKYSGEYDAAKGELPPFSIVVERESGDYPYMDTREYLAEASFTETQADYVIYVTPFDRLPTDEALTLTLRLTKMDVDFPNGPAVSVCIPATEKVAARNYIAEGVRAAVSPVGMTLCYENGDGAEKSVDSIVLRYADESQYTVMSADLVNVSVSSVSRDQSALWFAFNRLADADSITEIAISGHERDGNENASPYELILK